jgi:Zn-dependent protease with chaperone function
MDFYSHQDEARRRSRSLVWRFIIANLIVVVCVSALFLTVTAQVENEYNATERRAYSHGFRAAGTATHVDPVPLLIAFNSFILLTISISALLKFRALSSSGGAVAEMLGGRRIPAETGDSLERRYLNVIEEMAIAANMPVPEAYVLTNQRGINAFASGPTPEHSAIAVTRGALERLDREELQGVVAHEFSHIMHGDVRLNIRLAAYVYGLSIVTEIGLQIIDLCYRGRARRSDVTQKDSPILVFLVLGVIFMVFGAIGQAVSVLISAAISREREFLADATAVELTRNPHGITNALKKIGGFTHGSTVTGRATGGLSHFFLAQAGSRGLLNRIHATHPPLEERVRRLDPTFAGEFPNSESIALQTDDQFEGVSQLQAGRPSVKDACGFEVGPSTSMEVPFLHNAWVPPMSLHSDIVGVGTAEACVCVLLLSSVPDVRDIQEPLLIGWMTEDVKVRIERSLSTLSINQKLSVVLMALPTIQSASRVRRDILRRTVVQIAEATEGESLLEFLTAVLISYAAEDSDSSFTLAAGSTRQSLSNVQDDLSLVLTVCARHVASSAVERDELFRNATQGIKASCRQIPDEEYDVERFLGSLEGLRNASPSARAQLMKVFEKMVLQDGIVTENEVAIMRLFSILLRSALPDSVEVAGVRLAG